MIVCSVTGTRRYYWLLGAPITIAAPELWLLSSCTLRMHTYYNLGTAPIQHAENGINMNAMG